MTTGRINQVAIPSKIPNQGAGATARARHRSTHTSSIKGTRPRPPVLTRRRGRRPAFLPDETLRGKPCPTSSATIPPHLHHHLSGPISSFTMRGRVFPQVFPKRQSSPSLQVIPPPGLLRPQSAIRGRARKPRVTSFRRCRPIGTSSDGIQGPTASEPPLGTADSPRREDELGAKCPSKKCVPSSRRRTAAARCRGARPRAPCAPPERGQMVYLRSFFPDRGRKPDLGQ